MKSYEACFILNTAGKDADAKDTIDAIEKAIRDADGKTLKLQRMDKRPFARVTGPSDSGYYVNFVFEMDPSKVAAFRDKFKHSEDVHRLMLTEASKDAAEREPAPPAPVT